MVERFPVSSMGEVIIDGITPAGYTYNITHNNYRTDNKAPKYRGAGYTFANF